MSSPAPARSATPDVRALRADDPAADAVVVGVSGAGPVAAPDAAPRALIEALLEDGEARPALGHVAHLRDGDGVRWILVGVGEDGLRHDEDRRVATGAALRRAADLRARAVTVVVDDEDGAAAVAEAAVLVAHRPAKVDGRPSAALPDRAQAVVPTRAADAEAEQPAAAAPPAEGVRIAGPGGAVPGPSASAAIAAAAVVAAAQNEARRLQQLPANRLTPRALAVEALTLGDEIDGLQVDVELGEAALRARGMGLFAAVGMGSVEPPALIVARYEPAAAAGPLLGLIGKAVTYDSGGYSLKTPAGMTKMKLDMSGGAAVLQAVAAIARLRLPVRVVAVIGATENLVGPAAMKPGDVFVAANGTAVEVVNTDAEGRLVLADAMTHALALGAERLIDVATLTGGVTVALGNSHAGLLGHDEGWLDTVRGAGERTGERVWPLPLEDEHRDLLKSTSADMVNSGGRPAHASQGAAFLERFAGGVPWAHVDMAAMSSDLPRSYLRKGPSGWGVRLLVETARAVAG
ncbi:M17 family metallopeptidase [Patulibacter defluvii]|uniref:M17 family metallopeptidase n=1 Tax=Patulibacter defluvii TaxID=3095358 RepID=UPI002A74F2CA|nr:M17 family metallopeptidase [Patulibacter sp. DM4]